MYLFIHLHCFSIKRICNFDTFCVLSKTNNQISTLATIMKKKKKTELYRIEL